MPAVAPKLPSTCRAGMSAAIAFCARVGLWDCSERGTDLGTHEHPPRGLDGDLHLDLELLLGLHADRHLSGRRIPCDDDEALSTRVSIDEPAHQLDGQRRQHIPGVSAAGGGLHGRVLRRVGNGQLQFAEIPAFGVADHRNHQALAPTHGDADVLVIVVDDFVAVQGSIDHGMPAQRLDKRAARKDMVGSSEIGKIPLGAIGIYSYSDKLKVGLQQLMAGARKFRTEFITRQDLASLTEDCARITGIKYVMDAYREEALEIIDA